MDIHVGEWRIRIRTATGEGQTVILDRENRPVATIHGATFEEAFQRALLIARAPELRDAAAACHSVFKQMGDGWSRVAAAASEMLPVLESVVRNLVQVDDAKPPAP